jgi:CO dehydrogenase/acetyl-CoA synthase beta subunit
MKLTKTKLKQIIKEEIQKMLSPPGFDEAVQRARMVYDETVAANPEMTEQEKDSLYGKLLDKVIHEAGLTPRKMSPSLAGEAEYYDAHDAAKERGEA